MEFIDVGEVGVVGATLDGVVGSSGEGLGADIVGAKLEGGLGSSAGGIRVCSFSEDRVLLIRASLSSKSSLGKRSPPFGTFGIY